MFIYGKDIPFETLPELDATKESRVFELIPETEFPYQWEIPMYQE